MPSTLGFLGTLFEGHLQEALEGAQVVLFGAGGLGGALHDALRLHGIRPACFCDNDAARTGEIFRGLPVISFQELCARHRDSLIVITTPRIAGPVSRQLQGSRFPAGKVLTWADGNLGDLVSRCLEAVHGARVAQILSAPEPPAAFPLDAMPGGLNPAETQAMTGVLLEGGWMEDALAPGDRALAVLRDDRILSTLHLRPLEDPTLQRLAFKQGVNYIDVETSSQCNRKCSYCTNSTYDRFSWNRFMEPRIYEALLDQLAEIDYDKSLHFVGYNEPLMHRSAILDCIRRARARLPKAFLLVFTNGDFLDQAYLQELAEAGLDQITISIHLAPGEVYTDGAMIARVLDMGRRLRLEATLKAFSAGCALDCEFPHPRLKILMYQKDYQNIGINRGGLLSEVGEKRERTAPCHHPITQFIVGHLGTVMPCCLLVSDAAGHETSRAGTLGEGRTIFEIYAGEPYVSWRRSLLQPGPKTGPCATCTGFLDFPSLQEVLCLSSLAQEEAPRS